VTAEPGPRGRPRRCVRERVATAHTGRPFRVARSRAPCRTAPRARPWIR
jgi:hypothetical protein